MMPRTATPAVTSSDHLALRAQTVTTTRRRSIEITEAWLAAGVVFDSSMPARRPSRFGVLIGTFMPSAFTRFVMAALFSRCA